MSNDQRMTAMASTSKIGPIPTSTMADAVTQVLRLLRRINHATDLHSKHLIKATGLTTAQLIVLKAIHELGEVTAGTIAEHVSLSPGTVSILLDRLETHALIERYRSTKDRRVAHARLTQRGIDVVAGAPSLLREKFIEQFTHLEREAQLKMLTSLQTIADMMDADDGSQQPI